MEGQPRYHARVLGEADNGPGAWKSLRMGVFDGDLQLGEYVRNYHDYGPETFHAFEQGGRWLALYSGDYTSTRILSLPDCTDLGGEERDAWGFCPVDYLVPVIEGQEIDPAEPPLPELPNHQPEKWAARDATGRWRWPDEPGGHADRRDEYLALRKAAWEAHEAHDRRYPYVTRHARWGFVAGCVWGDDSSWKIQFLDLSEAARGIVKRDARFGYIELPRHASLRHVVDCESIHDFNAPPDEQEIRIALPVEFRLSGRRVDPAGR